jgi:hypothetical protein
MDTDKNDGVHREESPENAATYSRDQNSGEWKINNPSGSKGYNYLYRDEWSWLD